VQIKIDCDSGGEVMVDKDDAIVGDGDCIVVVEDVGIKPGFSAWSCAASLVGAKTILLG
jgi:hypothetical protein